MIMNENKRNLLRILGQIKMEPSQKYYKTLQHMNEFLQSDFPTHIILLLKIMNKNMYTENFRRCQKKSEEEYNREQQ